MKKHMQVLLMSTLFLSSLIQPVSAIHINAADFYTPLGVANFNQGTASITIHPNGNQSLMGKKFNVYQLFQAENATNLESINYTLNERYALALKRVVGKALNKEESKVTEYEIIDYMASLSDLQLEGAHSAFPKEGTYSKYRTFILDLRDTLKAMGIKGDTITVSEVKQDGSFTLTNLAYGYYLIDEVTDHQHQFAASSMCIVETANPTANVQIKSDYPTIIKKIQEDDQQLMIGFNGWNDMADFEMGQTIPYRFESTISNLNGYDTYYYAWHDKMDEALTLHPDSIQIKLSDDKKSYTLKKEEFKLLMQPSKNEAFMVEIENIKEIVDREFNQMNENKENVYGQKVVLTYEAHLNDLASKKTGQPGFENSVMLEFSNDPDRDGLSQTGYTSWDTVVCFTYSLQGLKVNDHQALLKNAKFKLYLDEACEKEVFVKKMEDGYHVSHDGTSSVEMVSNEDGKFAIYGLDSGEYWLKEVESPDGYRLLLDPIQLSIEATYSPDRNNYISGTNALIKLEASAYVKEFLDGLFGEKRENLETNLENGTINLTVINTVGSKLPHTGSNALVVYFCSGLLIVIFGTTLFKKWEKDEKVQTK